MNSTLRSFLRLVSVTLALTALTSAEDNNVKKNIDNVAPEQGIGRKLDIGFFEPTESPTPNPSEEPTKIETASPTFNPTSVPSEEPTATPTRTPTNEPTASPTLNPTGVPSGEPTTTPTSTPTLEPTGVPSEEPTKVPTRTPTFEPTGPPSSSPSRITSSPTAPFTTLTPTMAPTLCEASYLTSEKLNIGLVIDLSYSTYLKNFTSIGDTSIGDVNGDGKPNTILDAEILAVQDLLVSIAKSDTLNNANCEIGLISFDTDARFWGTWQPTNDAGDGFNSDLMEHIKAKLRAPTKNAEVIDFNRGFTNFDAALDVAVDYFGNDATANRMNLLVFLSDGEPNVRGDGDNEGFCAEEVYFWKNKTHHNCSDISPAVATGQRHNFCRDDSDYYSATPGDEKCVLTEPFQDCVRGPNNCLNHDATTQYDSEIAALDSLGVERLAIGIGDESNVEVGSALFKIDNNPAKNLVPPVLVPPIQALTLEELSSALSNLCILNTEPPTGSPSVSPTDIPTSTPTSEPTVQPTSMPTSPPTEHPTSTPTESPTSIPTTSPTPAPTSSPTGRPTRSPTSIPTNDPTSAPTSTPTGKPTGTPTESPSEPPSGSFFPSSFPTGSPTESSSPTPAPTGLPTASPTSAPTGLPTTYPTASPTSSPTAAPTYAPTGLPTTYPTASPTTSPTPGPTASPTLDPTISFSPTYVLPDCYDGPKMVVKDSSHYDMCEYNPDMVVIDNIEMMSGVDLTITNVWGEDAPEIMKIFVHSNGLDAVLPQNDGDGFQCLDDEGMDIDLTQDETSITAQCYPEFDAEGAAFYAVIDVVITDPFICGTNEVADPCGSPEPITESCSWRIVVPCSDALMCTEEPTASPTSSPTSLPTASPTSSPTGLPTTYPTASPTSSPTAAPTSSPTGLPTTYPTASPTSSPTAAPTYAPTGLPTTYPTASPTSSPTAAPTYAPTGLPTLSPTESPTSTPTSAPTAPFHRLGDDDDTDDNYFCPEDITVLKHEGVTTYPDGALTIISQDTTSVTVRLTQTLTDSNSTIDNIFYQYKPNHFDSTCLEEDDVEGGEFVEVTIECTVNTEIAMFEFWVVDDISKDVLSEGDDAVIPKCCHPEGVPLETPTTKYLIEIKCTTECPEVIQ